MPQSSLFLIVAIEILALLVIACVILMFRMRGLQRFIQALEAKIRALRDSVRSSRSEAKQAMAKLAAKEREKPKTYQDHLEDQLEETRRFHQDLDPDQDIALDIAGGVPMARQVASLRHAFLIAEQEAALAADGDSDWDVLEAKLGQVISFLAEDGSLEPSFNSDAPSDTDDGEGEGEVAENLRRRIANLERFRSLYFDLDKRWQQLNAEAKSYQQQLAALGKSLGAGEDFDKLIEEYAQSFAEMGQVFAQGKPLSEPGDNQVSSSAPSVGKVVIANQEEIQRLRNMAVDQHKVITGLKKQLVGAKTVEEKDAVIIELTQQLERQQRFLQEADTCTQLLEQELNRTLEDNQVLRAQLQQPNADASDPAELEQLEALVGDLTAESREMLATIGRLEEDNRTLEKQLADAANNPGADGDALKQQLNQLQAELLDLQAEHVALEERYLELKMQNL